MQDKMFLIHREILHDISAGVVYVQKGKISYVNPATLEILDKKESELVNKTFAEAFFEHSENDDFNQIILEVIYDSNHKHEKIVQYFTGAEIKYLQIRTSLLKFNSKPQGIIILINDVTELMKLRGIALDLEKIKEINRQLSTSRDFYKRNAEIDKLTALLNKITFENICSEYIEALAEDKSAALFVIDLDHFKEANDTHGHQFGDLILKTFADKLQKIFESEDLIGRFGGDEFVVLMKNIRDAEDVSEKAEAILKMATDLNFPGKELNLSASVGISIFNGSKKNYSEIFSTADKSVYVVKTQGRNGFSINGQKKSRRLSGKDNSINQSGVSCSNLGLGNS